MYNNNAYSKSPIYKKALDILSLSENISQYLNYEMCSLTYDGKEHPAIYLTGDIILHSNFLGDSILEAENEILSENRDKHLTAIEKWAYRLHKNCERLEQHSENGKEFIHLLKHEVRRFRVLQRKWMLSL